MNNPTLTTDIADEDGMLKFGAQMAAACPSTATVFLYGQLGAGKTTLTRGFLQGLGHLGKVKSPTYTLVEPYELAGQTVFHFDLYRLTDPQELEFIGLEDYFRDQAICIVEWPERGASLLPPADLSCYIEQKAEGRQLRLEAGTERGQRIVAQLTNIKSE